MFCCFLVCLFVGLFHCSSKTSYFNVPRDSVLDFKRIIMDVIFDFSLFWGGARGVVMRKPAAKHVVVDQVVITF